MKKGLIFLFLALLYIGCDFNEEDLYRVPQSDIFELLQGSKTILIGDSITERNDWKIPSYGIGGYTVNAMRGNLPDFTEYENVIILLGVNNLYCMDSIEKISEDMIGLCSDIGDKNIYIASVLPIVSSGTSRYTNETILNLNWKYHSLDPLFIDLFTSLYLAGNSVYTDGVHLNEYGYSVLEKDLYQYIDLGR